MEQSTPKEIIDAIKPLVIEGVTNKVLNDLAIELSDIPFPEEDKNIDLCDKQISTSTVGPLAPMFDQIYVKVSYGWWRTVIGDKKETCVRIIYQYSYTHPEGGRNGYTKDVYYRVNAWNGKLTLYYPL